MFTGYKVQGYTFYVLNLQSQTLNFTKLNHSLIISEINQ